MHPAREKTQYPKGVRPTFLAYPVVKAVKV